MSGSMVIILFFAFALFGLPVAFSMGMASVIYLLTSGIPFTVLAHRLPNALNSFPLVAVPIFILAGNLMNTSGVSERLFGFARLLVGRRKGGLAHVNIIASLIFSGISGAALADIGGLGNIEIKAMKDQGYDPADAAAITAASATIGPIFPPSIPLVIFASVAEASGVKLLLGGIVPAIIITALLMVLVTILAHKYNYPQDTELVTKERFLASLKTSFPALLTPILLIGGLLSGWFSPTEVASVTVAYSLFLGFFVYKELNWKTLFSMAWDTALSTGKILIVVACASVFAWILTVEQIPAQLSSFLLGISTNPVVLLLLVNVLLLCVGMVIDTIAAILIITPIIYPVMMSVGVDPVHLGIVVVLNLMIGLLTPPVGMSLYMVSLVAEQPVGRVIKKTVVYLIPLIIALLIVTLFPALTTSLPNLVFK